MNKKIIVNTKEKKYTIEINNNFILNRLKKISNNKSKLFIIIDTSVNYLLDNLNLSKNVCIIKIKGSEKIKDFKSYIYITKKILLRKFLVYLQRLH